MTTAIADSHHCDNNATLAPGCWKSARRLLLIPTRTVQLSIHHQGFYEFCLVLRGQGRFIHDNETFLLEPGSAIVADPEIRHELQQVGTEDLELVYWMLRAQTSGGNEQLAEAVLLNISSLNTNTVGRQ